MVNCKKMNTLDKVNNGFDERVKEFVSCLGNGRSIYEIEGEESREEGFQLRIIRYWNQGFKFKFSVFGNCEVLE